MKKASSILHRNSFESAFLGDLTCLTLHLAPDMLHLAIFAMYMCLGTSSSTSKTLNWTTYKNAHVTFKRTLNCSEYQPRASVHIQSTDHMRPSPLSINRSYAGLRLFLFTGASQKHSKDHMLDTPHRHSHRVPDLETSSLNKHQLKLFEQLGNDYKKMRSEYQAQVIDRTLVPKKMMPIVDFFCLHMVQSWKLWQWLDHFSFTHGAIVGIVVVVILMYFAYGLLLWAYVFLLFFKSAYWHIRAYGF